MKKRILICCMLIVGLAVSSALAAGNPKTLAAVAGADRLFSLQRTDSGWAGSWYLAEDGTLTDAAYLTGLTAMGLLEAYQKTGNPAYLEGCYNAANFITTYLSSYIGIWTAPDVVFIYRLGSAIGNEAYIARAVSEWGIIKNAYGSVSNLLTLMSMGVPAEKLVWETAFYLEAAYLCGDTAWADELAVAIVGSVRDDYPLDLAGAIRALMECGYVETYYEDIEGFFGNLVLCYDEENGIGNSVQNTAYAVMAFNAFGGKAHKYAKKLGNWLINNQELSGGWLELDGIEYPEVDGEAIRALAE